MTSVSQDGVNLDQEDRGSVEASSQAWWVTIYHLGVWQMNLGSTDARSNCNELELGGREYICLLKKKKNCFK